MGTVVLTHAGTGWRTSHFGAVQIPRNYHRGVIGEIACQWRRGDDGCQKPMVYFITVAVSLDQSVGT